MLSQNHLAHNVLVHIFPFFGLSYRIQKSLAAWLFVQQLVATDNKENIKAPP